MALRLSLELSVKHIRERARVMQRETYERNGEICVQPENAKFMADDGNAKDFNMRKRYIDTYAENTFGSGQSSYGNELQEYMRAFAKSRGTLGLGQSSSGSGNESVSQVKNIQRAVQPSSSLLHSPSVLANCFSLCIV